MNAQRYVQSIGVLVGLVTALLMVLTLLPVGLSSSTAQAQNGTARLRAVHAVPDIVGVPVDIYVNNENVAPGVDFFSATEYLDVPVGETDIAVVPAGGDPDTAAVITATVTLEEGQDYSAVARGTADDTDDADLGATLLDDDTSAPRRGYAKLRVAHFSPDAPAVDILVDGTKVISGLEYLEASAYLPLTTGSYTVEVAPAGGTPIYTDTLDIEAGQVVTAWANGLLDEAAPEDQAFTVTPTVDAEYFYLRAVHAVPDIAGSPVDVYVNGASVATFDFFDTTDYLALPGGDDYTVQVVPTGGDPDSEAVISDTLTADTFTTGAEYSLVARGTAADTDAADLGATLLTDDNTAPDAGQARIRAAHFSPDAPAVDVYANGTLAIEDLSYLDASTYLSVPAGPVTFGIAPADGAPIYTATVTLEAGKVYTAWANGLLGGAGAQAFAVTPTVDRDYIANVRVLHASPDAPAVDVLVSGEVVLSDVAFGDISQYLPLTEGTYTVSVRAAGDSEDVFSTSLFVEGGVSYTIAAIGLLSPPAAVAQDTSFTLLPIVDSRERPSEGQAGVRFVHLSPDAPTVDVRVGETVLFDDVEYPTVTDYIEVESGVITVDVTSGDGSETFLTVEVVLPSSTVSTIYAIGLANPEAPEEQQLRALLVTDLEAVDTLYFPLIGN